MNATAPNPLLPRLPLTLWASLAAVAGAILRVAIVPVLVGSLFDQVLVEGNFDTLLSVLVTGALVTAGGALALFLQDAFFGRLAARVSADWRDAAYASLLGRTALTREQSSGGLASRIIADLKETEIHLQYGLGSLVAESATILSIMAFLFYLNPLAAGALVLLALPLALVLGQLGKKVERASEAVLERTEAVGSHLQEGLGQLEAARAFGLSGFLRARHARDSDALLRVQSARAAWAGAQTPASQVLGYLALAALLVILIQAVRQGNMSLGEVTSFITLVALLGTPLQLLPRAWAMLRQARAAARRLRQLVPHGRAAQAGPAGKVVPEPVVMLDGVTFAYEPGTPVLQDVTLELAGPGLVALVGGSGAGKSTVIRLLLGLLSPGSGRVLLGGHEISGLSDAEVRRTVAYVPQDPALFMASVRDNLDLGRGFTDPQLWDALAEAGMAGTVRQLAGALDYRLSERGGGLSGGQLQRLVIARALLSDPAVLLLDEPTSSLDRESEDAIASMLSREAARRLVLLTTHRPSLLTHADRVIRLEEGGRIQDITVKEATGA